METLRYVLLANGLLAVVSIAYYVLLRRETFFGANRLVLWLGLAAALVLPLLELPDWRPQPVRKVMQRTAQVIIPNVLPKSSQPDVTLTVPNDQTYKAFPAQPTAFIWSWQLGLITLYWAVVVALLVRFVIQLVSLRRLIRGSKCDEYDDFTLLRNERITSPFSFFGWVVLNPDCHTTDELEQILRHERVHVRAWHSLDMIGTELVCIALWFNPAAYLFRYLIHQTLEFSADRAVLAEGVDAKTYQYNLVKVSLSSGQSAPTNHFSRSQLKSRIIMLNKVESSKTTWFKYPVLLIAVLTVASAFAHPQHIKAMSNYVPQSVEDAITAVTESPKEPLQPVAEARQVIESEIIKQKSAHSLVSNTPIQPRELQLDSVRNLPEKDSAHVSPSRYMAYQGDYLYWIITPKTTFDDFAVMKQEFSKHGCTMQLNEIKYDPLYAYINRIALLAVGPGGVQAKVEELDDENKPIPTNAGYITMKDIKDYEVWSSRLNGRFSKKFPLYKTAGEENFPDILRKVADDDESSINQFIISKKMEYLVLAGERKYGHLGIGFRKFDKEQVKKESSRGGFIEVNPDRSLSVDRAKNFTKIFINNEPVSHEDIRHIKINQLYTVAVVLGYDNAAQKRTGTDYLLFYIDEDK